MFGGGSGGNRGKGGSWMQRYGGYRQAVMALRPVAYWRLGEAGGTVAVDEVGTNHGTYVNAPTLGETGALTGDANTSVRLTGASNHRVTAAASASLNALADEMTYLVWIKRATTGTTQILTTKNTANSWTFRLSAANVLEAVKVGGAAFATGSSAITDTAWHLVGFTKTASGGKVWLDGVDNTASGTNSALSAVSATTYVVGFSASDFDGTVDDVAVWNRALSATEIASLYRAGSGQRP